MSRLFTLLCLAMFTLTVPACDDEDPKDTSTTAEDSSTGEASSTGNPDDLAPGGAGESSETGEAPGTATIATPHLTTDPDITTAVTL